MADKKAASRLEWRLHWPLLLAATIGISFGSLPTMTLGLFMEPLQDEFGWSRTTISLGLTIYAGITAPLSPFAGAIVDKFGSRTIAIPGLIICGILFAAFSLQNGTLEVWIAAWVIYSLGSLSIRSVVWNPPVSSVFILNRGVAIAILLSGMSLASAGAPLLAHTLIEGLGWRGAYIGIGLGWAGVALLLVIPFFHAEKPAKKSSPASGGRSVTRTVPGGLTGKEALRNPAILRIALAGLLVTTLASGYGMHMIPIYTSLGLERGEAAGLALLIGIAAVSSKLVSGSIADRVNSSFLPFTALSLPAAGYGLLLAAGGSIPMLMAAALVIGFGSGAGIHIIIYLTTQFGGLRNFGKIYGSVSALFGLSAGIGPVTAGAIFDATGSYELFLMIGIPMFVVSGLLVFGLGSYPDFKPVEIGPENSGEAAPARS
ncbi:MAG: MFS transporter [Sphingomonadaceae bacterium]|nr:MFS transporter [Sphingomonadaceae bacterium]